MMIQPYLFFNGTCEAASEFYRTAIGAEVESMMRYSDSPEPAPPGMVPPGSEHKIMHMSLKIGDQVVMAADDCSGRPVFQGFSMSLTTQDEAEARRAFAALGEGGTVKMPLTKTFFAKQFGMLTDRFGLGWMVMAA